MKAGVVIYPGSNCDQDVLRALQTCGFEAFPIWHQSQDLLGAELVVLPGGFSYGDYLRAGAIASRSPATRQLRSFAASGGLVLGICNGFQILVESGLLPGAFQRNRDLRFHCEPVGLRVETSDSPFTCALRAGQRLRLPIAHGEGNYFVSEPQLRTLEADDRIALRYVDETGLPSADRSPNGSVGAIAGLLSEERNVLGMMPHPERAYSELLGGTDGCKIFESIAAHAPQMQVGS